MESVGLASASIATYKDKICLLKFKMKITYPVIKTLAETTDVPISIDTSKPEVMLQAVESGASITSQALHLTRP
jgi:dihydropteroate synthase